MSRRHELEEDTFSFCGSISGEPFSTLRKRKACALRQHSIQSYDWRANHLHGAGSLDAKSQASASICSPQKQRLNTVFHCYRFLVIMFGGVSVGIVYFLRYSVSVTILKMVNNTAIYLDEHPNKTVEDFLAAGYTPQGEFHWDNEIQHMIMSWYMVAYTLPQVPMSRLGGWVGARCMVPLSLATCALSTLLTPAAAYWGWEWVIMLRLVNGIGASAVLPMLIGLIESWMPYDQLILGMTCAQILQAIMTATIPVVSGYLAAHHWSWAFYGPGGVTLLFCALWLVFISDKPDDNWLISQQELDIICDCGGDATDLSKQHKSSPTKGKHPNPSEPAGQELEPISWTRVLRLWSFYCYVIMWCLFCSAYSCFSFILPTYLGQFLKIPISENGLYCSFIQSGCILSVMWPLPFMSFLKRTFGFSETVTRRIAHFFICAMVGVTWVYIGLYHESQLLLLFINRIFHASNDVVVTGTLMTNYAKAGLSSLVFSMVNTVGNLTIVFTSTGIGWILDYTGQSRAGWSWIYFGLGASQLLYFLLFITGIQAGPVDLGPRKPKRDLEGNARADLATVNEAIMSKLDKPKENGRPASNQTGDCTEKQAI